MATDVQFATRPGFDPNLTSLTTYRSEGRTNAPIIVFIHGGGWVSGDKDAILNTPIVDAFLDDGAVVVAANYRPVAVGNGVRYAQQADDVAAALGWVHGNAQTFGGDPKRILLMGFSSGAHLVSLVATDPRYLDAYGLTVNHLSGVVALDVPAYDIPYAISQAGALGWPQGKSSLEAIFSTDLTLQRDASPQHHIEDTATRPPFLIVSAQYQPTASGLKSTDFTRALSARFTEALTASETAAEHVHFPLTHTELVNDLGNDNELTAAVWGFWQEVDLVELITNGGFEAPVVTHRLGWDIFGASTPGLGWNVAWTSAVPLVFQRCLRPAAKLELQKDKPFAGNQHAELDSDWNGPDSNQSCAWVSLEPSSLMIWQDLPTCEGATYTVTYAWRPRAALPVSAMNVVVNGTVAKAHSGNMSVNQKWNSESFTFEATGTSTRLLFREVGTADSIGMLLDSVSVRGPSCAPPPC